MNKHQSDTSFHYKKFKKLRASKRYFIRYNHVTGEKSPTKIIESFELTG